MTEIIQKNVFLLALFFSQEVSIANGGFSEIKGTHRNLSFEMLSHNFMGAVAEETNVPPFFSMASPSLGLISNASQ